MQRSKSRFDRYRKYITIPERKRQNSPVQKETSNSESEMNGGEESPRPAFSVASKPCNEKSLALKISINKNQEECRVESGLQDPSDHQKNAHTLKQQGGECSTSSGRDEEGIINTVLAQSESPNKEAGFFQRHHVVPRQRSFSESAAILPEETILKNQPNLSPPISERSIKISVPKKRLLHLVQ